MKPRTKNITKGAAREVKGKLKEAAGRLTGKKRLEAKGLLESTAGHAQRKLGEAQRDLAKQSEHDTDSLDD